MKTQTQRHETPLLQTNVYTSWHALVRKPTRALRKQRSFEKDYHAKTTSAAGGNLILMSQKQNTNKTKATVLWKHALSYIQILPHLSAQACQNCSLSLPLQDYRQSARDKTHTRLINANAFIVRTGNKQKPERHPFG